MFYSVNLTLLCAAPLSVNMSSLFHGVLMEALANNSLSNYADELHESMQHEYSMHIEEIRDKNEWHWIINLLNDRAFENIWQKTLSKLSTFKLRRQELDIRIVSNSVTELSNTDLFNIFKNNEKISKFQINILTPVSFKSNGKYIIFPDISLILQSLIKRYDSVIQNETLTDSETFKQLCDNCFICGYRLKSANFHLEGIKIPGFIGSITIKCKGTTTMSNFLNMLFTFGVFSGIGIKTSMGMGAYSYSALRYTSKV